MIRWLWLFLKNQVERFIALELPSVFVSPFLVTLELIILRGDFWKFAHLRTIYLVAIILTNPAWEFFRQRFQARLKTTPIGKWIADSLAVFVYKTTLFLLCVLIMWRRGSPIAPRQVALLIVVYFFVSMVIGRFSGIALDWLRKRWNNAIAPKNP